MHVELIMRIQCLELNSNISINTKQLNYINKYFNLRASESGLFVTSFADAETAEAEGRHHTEVTRTPTLFLQNV